MIVALIEETDAIDWYGQSVERDTAARPNMIGAQEEESSSSSE